MSFSIPVEDLSRFSLVIHVKDSKVLSFELKSAPTSCTLPTSSSSPSINLQASGDESNLEINVSLSGASQGSNQQPQAEPPKPTLSSSVQQECLPPSLLEGASHPPSAFGANPFTKDSSEQQPQWSIFPSQADLTSTDFQPPHFEMDWEHLLSSSQLPLEMDTSVFDNDGGNPGLFSDNLFGEFDNSLATFPDTSNMSTPSLTYSPESVSTLDPLSTPVTANSSIEPTTGTISFVDAQAPLSTIEYNGEDRSKPSRASSPSPRGTQRPRPFPCKHPNCKREFTSTYTREIHMSTHNPKNKKSHLCTMGCGMTFSRKHDRWRHEVSQHGKTCEWTCEKCSHFFSSKKMLSLHQCCGPIQSRWAPSE